MMEQRCISITLAWLFQLLFWFVEGSYLESRDEREMMALEPLEVCISLSVPTCAKIWFRMARCCSWKFGWFRTDRCSSQEVVLHLWTLVECVVHHIDIVPWDGCRTWDPMLRRNTLDEVSFSPGASVLNLWMSSSLYRRMVRRKQDPDWKEMRLQYRQREDQNREESSSPPWRYWQGGRADHVWMMVPSSANWSGLEEMWYWTPPYFPSTGSKDMENSEVCAQSNSSCWMRLHSRSQVLAVWASKRRRKMGVHFTSWFIRWMRGGVSCCERICCHVLHGDSQHSPEWKRDPVVDMVTIGRMESLITMHVCA